MAACPPPATANISARRADSAWRRPWWRRKSRTASASASASSEEVGGMIGEGGGGGVRVSRGRESGDSTFQKFQVLNHFFLFSLFHEICADFLVFFFFF